MSQGKELSDHEEVHDGGSCRMKEAHRLRPRQTSSASKHGLGTMFQGRLLVAGRKFGRIRQARVPILIRYPAKGRFPKVRSSCPGVPVISHITEQAGIIDDEHGFDGEHDAQDWFTIGLVRFHSIRCIRFISSTLLRLRAKHLQNLRLAIPDNYHPIVSIIRSRLDDHALLPALPLFQSTV